MRVGFDGHSSASKAAVSGVVSSASFSSADSSAGGSGESAVPLVGGGSIGSGVHWRGEDCGGRHDEGHGLGQCGDSCLQDGDPARATEG